MERVKRMSSFLNNVSMLEKKAALADRLAEALRTAGKLLDKHITDDCSAGDQMEADEVKEALKNYDALKGE